jgi:hypothetical protein
MSASRVYDGEIDLDDILRHDAASGARLEPLVPENHRPIRHSFGLHQHDAAPATTTTWETGVGQLAQAVG